MYVCIQSVKPEFDHEEEGIYAPFPTPPAVKKYINYWYTYSMHTYHACSTMDSSSLVHTSSRSSSMHAYYAVRLFSVHLDTHAMNLHPYARIHDAAIHTLCALQQGELMKLSLPT
jgi:hypothetical protein